MKLSALVAASVGALCLHSASAGAGGFKQLVQLEDSPTDPESPTSFLEVQLISSSVAASTHYGNPAEGCMADEVAVHIQGVKGAICSPKCTSGACPSDEPAGTDATPQCLLQDAGSGNKYCALACTKATTCPASASCQMVMPGIGLCTYA